MLGIVAMAGLLFYDGSQRINVTVILAFVLLQLALALATTLQAVIGWQPWRWLGRRLRLPDAPPVHARLRPLFMARAAQAGGHRLRPERSGHPADPGGGGRSGVWLELHPDAGQ